MLRPDKPLPDNLIEKEEASFAEPRLSPEGTGQSAKIEIVAAAPTMQ